MYNILALIIGLAIAVMISINGNLTQQYGAFWAAVVIHVVGVVFAFILCRIQKTKPAPKGHYPLWIYLGGVIGVLTTVFNNLAYGTISMTSIIALGLLGQTVASLLIDSLGLFGMEKHPLKKMSFIGLAFSMTGIIIMLDASVMAGILAVMFSFGAGITVVLSRTVNARLAEKTGDLKGSFINHLTGLPVTILAALLLAGPISLKTALSSTPVWVYCGGMIGVIVVLLFNTTVPRLSAYRLTLFTFIGQLFTGILIDCLLGKHYSSASFSGGLIIAGGVVINLLLEKYVHHQKYSDKA